MWEGRGVECGQVGQFKFGQGGQSKFGQGGELKRGRFLNVGRKVP